MATSSTKHNVTIWRPSVCPVGMRTMTKQAAICNVASIHFSLTIGSTNLFITIAITVLFIICKTVSKSQTYRYVNWLRYSTIGKSAAGRSTSWLCSRRLVDVWSCRHRWTFYFTGYCSCVVMATIYWLPRPSIVHTHTHVQRSTQPCIPPRSLNRVPGTCFGWG